MTEPVHSSLSPDIGDTAARIGEAYRRDGFVAVAAALTPAARQWASDYLERFIAAVCAGAPAAGVALSECAGRRFVTGVFPVLPHLGPVPLYLLGSPLVAEAARTVCGADALPTHDWLVVKNAGIGPSVGWHQDFVHDRRWPAVNIGIHLDAAAADAVRLIPCTRGERQEMCELERRYDYDSPEVVRAVVEPGGLTLHDVMLVHGSPSLAGPQPRRKTYYVEFRPAAALAGLPPEHVALRRRLFELARECRERLGDHPDLPFPSPLTAAEEALAEALAAHRVQPEPANYCARQEGGGMY